jgi:four helix bundle protein
VIERLGDLAIASPGPCTPDELRRRSKEFAHRIVRLFGCLPRDDEGRILGRQLLRSGTSVAANYRAACRARSMAEFVAKLGIAVEEADETVFWLELLGEASIVPKDCLRSLLAEANELLAILSASRRTAKGSITKSPNLQFSKSPNFL